MTAAEPDAGPDAAPDDAPAPDPTAKLSRGAVAALATRGREVRASDRLHGGTIARTLRLHLDDGSTVVLKQSRHVPEGAWEAEVDGLAGLRAGADAGGPAVPEVLGVGEDYLLLEDFGHPIDDSGPFWEAFGRQLAALHDVHGERYGWHRDNLLGAVAQRNAWHDDGHAFFVEQRWFRYLDHDANVQSALTAADRDLFERVASRLTEIVPVQPPALTHGDLWRSNVLAAGPARPALCDPAVAYQWAEVDLSMLWCSGGVPEACFAAYREVHPLDDDWQDRMPLLHVRENLSVLAHVGYDEATVAEIRAALSSYA